MSGTITYTAQLAATIGSGASGVAASANSGVVNQTTPIVGTNFTQGTMSVPTTAGGTAIPKGSIGTPGWIWIKNLDSTNYLTILNATSGQALVQIDAGECVLFRLAASAPAALANTATIEMQYLMVEA